MLEEDISVLSGTAEDRVLRIDCACAELSYGIAIMIVVALIMARDYNRIATNPVPQFRKTGGNLNGKY